MDPAIFLTDALLDWTGDHSNQIVFTTCDLSVVKYSSTASNNSSIIFIFAIMGTLRRGNHRFSVFAFVFIWNSLVIKTVSLSHASDNVKTTQIFEENNSRKFTSLSIKYSVGASSFIVHVFELKISFSTTFFFFNLQILLILTLT